MNVKHLPHDLTLDYDTWICGNPDPLRGLDVAHGRGTTKMLNEYGFLCCLGQFYQQAGATREQLICVTSPQSVPVIIVEELATPVRTTTGQIVRDDTELTQEAVKINDSQDLTIPKKVVALQTLFVDHVIWLKGFPAEYLEQIGQLKI